MLSTSSTVVLICKSFLCRSKNCWLQYGAYHTVSCRKNISPTQKYYLIIPLSSPYSAKLWNSSTLGSPGCTQSPPAWIVRHEVAVCPSVPPDDAATNSAGISHSARDPNRYQPIPGGPSNVSRSELTAERCIQIGSPAGDVPQCTPVGRPPDPFRGAGQGNRQIQAAVAKDESAVICMRWQMVQAGGRMLSDCAIYDMKWW